MSHAVWWTHGSRWPRLARRLQSKNSQPVRSTYHLTLKHFCFPLHSKFGACTAMYTSTWIQVGRTTWYSFCRRCMKLEALKVPPSSSLLRHSCLTFPAHPFQPLQIPIHFFCTSVSLSKMQRCSGYIPSTSSRSLGTALQPLPAVGFSFHRPASTSRDSCFTTWIQISAMCGKTSGLSSSLILENIFY